MPGEHPQLYQIIALVETPVPNLVSFLEQIKMDSGTKYAAIVLMNAFFSVPITK